MGVARIMEKYRHKPFSFSSSSWYSTDWNRLPETTTSANIIESFRMQLSSSQAAYFTH
jgi:hypothetical protein